MKGKPFYLHLEWLDNLVAKKIKEVCSKEDYFKQYLEIHYERNKNDILDTPFNFVQHL